MVRIEAVMSSQQSALAHSVRKEYNKALLYGALALAGVTAIVHIYTAYTDIAPYGVNVAVPLFLIALVYLGGIGLIAANYKRNLWIKVGIGWVLLVLILWVAAAANTDTGGTRLLLTFIDKGIEVVLLGLLVGLWMMKGKNPA